jgi:tetratricopeptide (TPR) repeat protein
MTPSHDLFRLIKSLSPTEKAYFQKTSSFAKQKEGKNIYLVVFDAIAKQKVYDEEKIKQKFKGEVFMKQFPVIKNYLYSRILDSLEHYHSEMNQRFVMRKMMNRAELLRRRGLYDQSMKILKKAKTFATENEMHLPLLDIYIHIELGLALEKYDMSWIERVNKEIVDNLALFKNDAAMHDVNFRIAVYYHKYLSTRNPQFLQKAKEIINSKYLSDVSMAKSFFGKNRFYESHAFYSFAKGDMKAVYANTKKIVSNFESVPNMLTRNFASYLSSLNNFIEVCAELRKHREGMEYLEKLKSYPQLLNSYSIRSRVFYIYNYLFLFLNNNSGYFNDSGEAIPVIIRDLKLYEDELNHSEKGMLYVNIAITYFGLGDIKSSIRWQNKIRNEVNLQDHPELDCFVRMFYLVAHYESNNNDLIASLIRSDYRFLSKKANTFELEVLFLDFLKNILPKSKSPAHKIEILKELKKKFIPLMNHPQERIYFKYFDFVSWLDSKILDKPFSEVVKKYNAD